MRKKKPAAAPPTKLAQAVPQAHLCRELLSPKLAVSSVHSPDPCHKRDQHGKVIALFLASESMLTAVERDFNIELVNLPRSL